jgi:alpha-D-xyloside xylohydrolase
MHRAILSGVDTTRPLDFTLISAAENGLLSQRIGKDKCLLSRFSHLLPLAICILSTFIPFAAWAQTQVTREPDGILVRLDRDALRLIVCSAQVIHVVAAPLESRAAVVQPAWLVKPCASGDFSLRQDEHEVVIETAQLAIHISLAKGTLSIADKKGRSLLRELDGDPRHYERRSGADTYSVAEIFRPAEDEAFYGLGQHQNGIFNNRGSSVILAEENTDIAIPFFLSTAGYGILWNSAAASLFDNRFPSELKLTAEAASSIDYYFLYGPAPDQIIHHYRDLTGHVPLYPRWAYGLFQSKDRYKSQAEVLDIAAKYRSLHIPLDALVQDYMWWTKQGASDFNANYPDPTGMVEELHRRHFHAMISIWPDFDEGTEILTRMQRENLLVPGTSLYDVTNPVARDLYWDALPAPLLKKGFDAFWIDASEPEDESGSDGVLRDKRLHLGDGALLANTYPLFHSESLYQHWRNTLPAKRVFLLTRSAFVGQQRDAAASWSGDVQSNFWAFSRQIPAGLNFMLSGMPYWTTDIGGYGYPAPKDTRDPAYQEVFVRWLEYGTFCPLFRIHGHRANDENEIWSYGPVAPILVRYDKLRYRLLPYIYSQAWQVSANDSTLMRPLVMDFRDDRQVWNIGDEFLFGPAILVSPVTVAGAADRSVYLPGAATWYDFWTGERKAGGQRIHTAAPLERIPLFVRGGSILPLGPDMEFADEKPADPIELRIYRGAEAALDLYEDEGDNYNYEKGLYALIPIRWDEASKTLRIGPRAGRFPGMLKRRTFRIVWVSESHGIGAEPAPSIDRIVEYQGKPIAVTAP